jgi:hypothetical protein
MACTHNRQAMFLALGNRAGKPRFSLVHRMVICKTYKIDSCIAKSANALWMAYEQRTALQDWPRLIN